MTYTTAHSSAWSLTHWARPGIEPATSRFQDGVINHWATVGTPYFFFFFRIAPIAYGSPRLGLHLSHSCHLHHSCGNAESFNPRHWAGDWTLTSAATQAAAVRFLTHKATEGHPSLWLTTYLSPEEDCVPASGPLHGLLPMSVEISPRYCLHLLALFWPLLRCPLFRDHMVSNGSPCLSPLLSAYLAFHQSIYHYLVLHLFATWGTRSICQH